MRIGDDTQTHEPRTHNTHADECVFYLCDDGDIGWRAFAFVWPWTLPLLKMSKGKRWQKEIQSKGENKRKKERELIKIFFDRFSNLEIIFFPLRPPHTRRIYLFIVIIIVWCTFVRIVCVLRRYRSLPIARYARARNGRMGSSHSTFNSHITSNLNAIGFAALLMHMREDSIWISPLIRISSKGEFIHFIGKPIRIQKSRYLYASKCDFRKFPYY